MFRTEIIRWVLPGLMLMGLSGCTLFGHQVEDGVWFPILLVTSMIGLLVWRVFAMVGRRSGYRDNASYFDSSPDGHVHGHRYDNNDGDGNGDTT